jgi:hypothetical protein
MAKMNMKGLGGKGKMAFNATMTSKAVVGKFH